MKKVWRRESCHVRVNALITWPAKGSRIGPPLVHALFQREPICTPFLASYSAIPKPCESQLTPTSSVILSDHLTILEFSRRQTRGSVSLWLVLSWIPSSHPQVATWASLWLDESFPASVHGRIQAPRASAWGPVDAPDTPKLGRLNVNRLFVICVYSMYIQISIYIYIERESKVL